MPNEKGLEAALDEAKHWDEGFTSSPREYQVVRLDGDDVQTISRHPDRAEMEAALSEARMSACIEAYLRAASKDAEPVAYRWRSTKGGWGGEWQLEGNRAGVEWREPSHYEVQPLFTHPSTGGEGGVRVTPDWSIPKSAKWCQPGDKQDERYYLVRFEDPDCKDAVFTRKEDALAFYKRACVSWNCWLFAAMPVSEALTAIEPVAASPGVPDGWKAVPAEPSDAMIEAGLDSLRDNSSFLGIDRDPLFVWRAMLAAAPSPEPSPASEDVLGQLAEAVEKYRKATTKCLSAGGVLTDDPDQTEWWNDLISAQQFAANVLPPRALSSKQRSEKE